MVGRCSARNFSTPSIRGYLSIKSDWRRERLPLLNHVGDENSGPGVARLTARVWRFGRYLEGIAGFDHAGRLTLDGNLEVSFEDIGGLDSRMGVATDLHARLDALEQKTFARRGPKFTLDVGLPPFRWITITSGRRLGELDAALVHRGRKEK